MTLTLAGYASVITLAFALWGYSKIRPNQVAPFGTLVTRLMQRRRNRLAVLAIWWWLGWHFFTNVPLASLGA
jgi:hypothetical protein